MSGVNSQSSGGILPPRPAPAGSRPLVQSRPPPPEKDSPFAESSYSSDYTQLTDGFVDDPQGDEYSPGSGNGRDSGPSGQTLDHGSGSSAAGVSSGGSGSSSKPSLSAFKQRFKSKASEAAAKTAEWRAKAAEKGTELQAQAKAKVSEWESKQKERRAAGSGSGSGSGQNSADALANPVFGVSVAEALERSRVNHVDSACLYPEHVVRAIPAVFFRCVEYLDVHGLDEVGIYRVSGSTSEVAQIRNLFNQGQDVELVGQQIDPNAVASLFKAWLRELPQSILTDDVSIALSRLYKVQDEAALLNSSTVDPTLLAEMRVLVSASALSFTTRSILFILFSHLQRVAQRESVNKMGLPNLQVIFCPTLGVGSGLFRVLVTEARALFGDVLTEQNRELSLSQGSLRSQRPGTRSADVQLESSGTVGISPPKPKRPSSISASTALDEHSQRPAGPVHRPSSAGDASQDIAPAPSTWDEVYTVPVSISRSTPSATMRVSWGSGSSAVAPVLTGYRASDNSAYSVGNSAYSSAYGANSSAGLSGSPSVGGVVNLMDAMDPFADVPFETSTLSSSSAMTPVPATYQSLPHQKSQQHPSYQSQEAGSHGHHRPQSADARTGGHGSGYYQHPSPGSSIWTPPRVGSLAGRPGSGGGQPHPQLHPHPHAHQHQHQQPGGPYQGHPTNPFAGSGVVADPQAPQRLDSRTPSSLPGRRPSFPQ
ncbi:hypothetical protein HKX48_009150 [Thoreauomyces humboldtii]|nr:hypothetical protein HKX48_009150 [Thoreauomyces humboldtii]